MGSLSKPDAFRIVLPDSVYMVRLETTARAVEPEHRQAAGPAGGRERGEAMDNLSSSAPVAAAEISVIGSGISVTGDIHASVDLHILGKVVGNVRCAVLLLGAEGEVTGDVFADAVRLAGRVHGRVEARDVSVEGGARIAGDVAYSRIRISSGGIVDGRLSHRPGEEEGAGTARIELAEEKPKRAAAQVVYIE